MAISDYRSCGCQCPGAGGDLLNWRARLESLCACDRSCWTTFGSSTDLASDLEDCLEECDDAKGECLVECEPDLEEIISAEESCVDTANADRNQCRSDCFDTQAACESACGGDSGCISACILAEQECRLGCDVPYAESMYSCRRTATAGTIVATEDSFLCNADCCEEDEEGKAYSQCSAEAERVFYMAQGEAEVTEMACFSNYIIGWGFNQPIFSEEAGATCGFIKFNAASINNVNRYKALDACQQLREQRLGRCVYPRSSCRRDAIGKYMAAIHACELAYLQSDGGQSAADQLPHCKNTAAGVLWDEQLICCEATSLGIDKYTRELLDCEKPFRTCMTNVGPNCRSLDPRQEEICLDPEQAEACLAAMEAWQVCLMDQTTTCNDIYTACKEAIEEPQKCGGVCLPHVFEGTVS